MATIQSMVYHFAHPYTLMNLLCSRCAQSQLSAGIPCRHFYRLYHIYHFWSAFTMMRITWKKAGCHFLEYDAEDFVAARSLFQATFRPTQGCRLTSGYAALKWANHDSAWPRCTLMCRAHTTLCGRTMQLCRCTVMGRHHVYHELFSNFGCCMCPAFLRSLSATFMLYI